jgi:integrase
MQFSRTTVASLSLPEGRTDFVFWDPDLPCFEVRLRGDTRRWIVQYRYAGQSRRESLGDPRKVGLEDARRIARARFAQIELGIDPKAERAKTKAAAEDARLTLAYVSDRYLEAQKPKVRPATYAALTRDLKVHWAPLAGRPIKDIERRNVAAQLGEITQGSGRTAAARARINLSAMFSWAMGEALCDANPVVATNNPRKGIGPRTRVLDDDELRIVWRACGDDDFGRIVRLLMLTGCRRDEIAKLRWSELDPVTSVLTIPGNRTKSHHALKLPLPRIAIATLPSRVDDREFVFGPRRGFRSWSYYTALLNRRIAGSEGRMLAPWTLHDLRRTLRTGLGRLGVAPHVAELVLNHVKKGMIAVYDQYNYQGEIAAALALWADHVTAAVNGRPARRGPAKSTHPQPSLGECGASGRGGRDG